MDVGLAPDLSNCLFFEPSHIEAAAEQLNVRNFSAKDVRLNYQLFEPGNLEPTGFRFARRTRLINGLRPIGNIEKPERAA